MLARERERERGRGKVFVCAERGSEEGMGEEGGGRERE